MSSNENDGTTPRFLMTSAQIREDNARAKQAKAATPAPDDAAASDATDAEQPKPETLKPTDDAATTDAANPAEDAEDADAEQLTESDKPQLRTTKVPERELYRRFAYDLGNPDLGDHLVFGPHTYSRRAVIGLVREMQVTAASDKYAVQRRACQTENPELDFADVISVGPFIMIDGIPYLTSDIVACVEQRHDDLTAATAREEAEWEPPQHIQIPWAYDLSDRRFGNYLLIGGAYYQKHLILSLVMEKMTPLDLPTDDYRTLPVGENDEVDFAHPDRVGPFVLFNGKLYSTEELATMVHRYDSVLSSPLENLNLFDQIELLKRRLQQPVEQPEPANRNNRPTRHSKLTNSVKGLATGAIYLLTFAVMTVTYLCLEQWVDDVRVGDLLVRSSMLMGGDTHLSFYIWTDIISFIPMLGITAGAYVLTEVKMHLCGSYYHEVETLRHLQNVCYVLLALCGATMVFLIAR